LPEFRRNVLEVMRQPLEDGNITVSHALGSINYERFGVRPESGF
jgi:magnesium chelatase family protein